VSAHVMVNMGSGYIVRFRPVYYLKTASTSLTFDLVSWDNSQRAVHLVGAVHTSGSIIDDNEGRWRQCGGRG